MIRKLQNKDELNFIVYYSSKTNCSLQEAKYKFKQIIKSSLLSFIEDNKEFNGICWIENKVVNDSKIKCLHFLVNNWRIAEDFFQMLKWNYNGEVIVELDIHHFLNRTLNKNYFKFLKVENNKNIFSYKFEKRQIFGKSESDE